MTSSYETTETASSCGCRTGYFKSPVVSYRRYRIISSGSDLEIICINHKKK
ncbi:hypothetical protein [Dialister invisus]|uniref:hypothetical protein n=1 Tax=Dialister invisus TaxID=218538 RepID=UPI003FD85561